MVLCLDIGNTTSHWGLVDSEGPGRNGSWETTRMATHLPVLLSSLRNGGEPPEALAFSSVAPRATETLESVLSVADWGAPVFQLTSKTCRGLELCIDVPSELGADRIAAAVGVQSLYRLPAIVIDMGTAVTVDAVTARGYMGGVIAPGLAIMTRYLHEQTALLPELDPGDLETESGLGRNTLDQMKIGCRVGFGGMVERLVERIESDLHARGEAPASIVATGGSVPVLLPELRSRLHVEPHLLLRGLHEAWRRNRG